MEIVTCAKPDLVPYTTSSMNATTYDRVFICK